MEGVGVALLEGVGVALLEGVGVALLEGERDCEGHQLTSPPVTQLQIVHCINAIFLFQIEFQQLKSPNKMVRLKHFCAIKFEMTHLAEMLAAVNRCRL